MALRDQFLALRDRFWPCEINFWPCEIVFGLARSILAFRDQFLAMRDRFWPCEKAHGLARRPIALREGSWLCETIDLTHQTPLNNNVVTICFLPCWQPLGILIENIRMPNFSITSTSE